MGDPEGEEREGRRVRAKTAQEGSGRWRTRRARGLAVARRFEAWMNGSRGVV